jgi:hypothetical protein
MLLAVGAIVLVPLAREYLDFRRSWGLGRAGALATTGLVLPASAVGLALSLPLSSRPALQWAATVVAAVVVYSLAVRTVANAVEPARRPS